jgi:flavin reductase
MLAVEQAGIASRFADPKFRETRFEGFDWNLHDGVVPVISGSQASLVCARKGPLEHGSHSILIGEVLHAEAQSGINPLLYADGGFAHHIPLGR